MKAIKNELVQGVKIQWVDYIDVTGYSLRVTLPGACIDDCSGSGDVSEAVAFWVRRLGFDAPEAGTREYLKGFGAWDDDQLGDHATNVERLLWSIACDLHEEYTK